MFNVAELQLQFKALADPQRLRVIALCRHGEVSVGELCQLLSLSQPRVSQHLKQLCAAGLLERFRDGKRAYYRPPTGAANSQRKLLDLIPVGDAQFVADAARLREMRGREVAAGPGADTDDSVGRRELHRALLDLSLVAPLGEVLDIGCGRGQVLKLLGGRATRAIGVDIDSDARDLARAELMLAGLPNCSLRNGDMYNLPFPDSAFDTLVLDDVLATSADPVAVLSEASRVLRSGGRLLVLTRLADTDGDEFARRLAAWSASAGFRIGAPRFIPRTSSRWVLSVATLTESDSAAA